MPARTDGRWTMTMMTRTDCPCVRLSVREARASVWDVVFLHSFVRACVRHGTERNEPGASSSERTSSSSRVV